MDLTEAERIAKEHVLLIWRNGENEPCDENLENPFLLPDWYDEERFKKGQAFFRANRWAILESNLIGLICLLADKRGLQILASTGKSGDADSARSRYFSTVRHTVSWYQNDLFENSISGQSLMKVRKIHFNASKIMEDKFQKGIMQSILALTAFGFMGFPLLYPKTMGIICESKDDFPNFVHFWAVICNMIGVKDKYNICLLPLDSLKIVCQMLIRYTFLPHLQIESELFRIMIDAMLKGIGKKLPFPDPEVFLWLTKIYCQVPGFHYGLDESERILCRNLLTQSEVEELNFIINGSTKEATMFPLSKNVPVISIEKYYKNTTSNRRRILSSDIQYVYNEMKLQEADYVVQIAYLQMDKQWTICDKTHYDKLKFLQRLTIWAIFCLKRIYQFRIARKIIDFVYVLHARRN